MGCRSSVLLVLTDKEAMKITKDLIMFDTERDRIERLSRATFKVMQLVHNINMYSKEDQKKIEEFYFKVQEKQLKEEDRQKRRKSINSLAIIREED